MVGSNLLVNYPFPIIAGASLFFLTLGIILSGFIYMIYFQWNLMCIYKINGKPISQRKQPILQKVSAVIMYIFLLLHFGLYGIFIHSLSIWGCNDSCFWFYESTCECWWESELDGCENWVDLTQINYDFYLLFGRNMIRHQDSK